MTDGGELAKAFWRTLAEISKNEKEKAIQYEDYDDALIVGLFEGLCREAEKSLGTRE